MKILKFGLIGVIVLVLLGVASFIYLGMQSRNGTAPGLVDGQLTACPSSPNCVSSEVGTEPKKKVDPLPLSAWEALPGLIQDMGGEITNQTEDYIASEFTSSTFGFVDDVEFRLSESEVQVRSASRVGRSDAGVNSARVAELRSMIGS